jgi:branched-chain amino acid transport system substrate-binding protein
MLSAPIAIAALVLTACGGSGGSSAASSGSASQGGVSGDINIGVISDQSGAGGFAGTPGLAGLKYGFDEMKKSGMLKNININLDVQDTGSNTSTAARLASQFVQQQKDIIIGPTLSSEAVAVAPVVAKSNIPMTCTQCGSDGVLIGPSIYRLTAPQSTYQQVTAKYLQSKNVKNVSLLYNNAVPTITDLAEKVWPSLAGQYGLKFSNNVAVGLTQTDFSSAAASLVNQHPDAIGVLLTGAPNVSAVSQLRDAGFTGVIFGQQGMGAGVLAPGGSKVDGTVYGEDYNVGGTTDIAKKFESGYKTATGQEPNNFSAEGYDEAYFIGRALVAAKSKSPSDVVASMKQIAAKGFDGAVGPIKFEGNDERVAGVLVQWANGKQTTIS